MESPIVCHHGPGPLDAPSVVWDITASWRGTGGGISCHRMALSVPALPWTELAVVSSPQMVLGFLGTELQAVQISFSVQGSCTCCCQLQGPETPL